MAIKKYIIGYFIVTFSLTLTNSYSQPGFKKVINFDNSQSLNFDDIQFHNNKLFITGNAFIDSLGLWGQNLAEFDTNGILQWQNTYFDSSLSSHIVSNTPARFFISDIDKFFIPVYLFNRGNLGIIILDPSGNELIQAEYKNEEFTIYPKEITAFQNNIYAFGTHQRENYNSDNYIIKTDSLGRLIWNKYYGTSAYDEYFGDLIDNKDGTFTISSSRSNDGFFIEPFGSQGWRKPWIFTIDTSGNIISQWLGEENDPKTLGGGPFYHLPDGDWIIISSEFKGIIVQGAHITATANTITKLDKNFHLIWKHYLADFTGMFDNLVDLEFDSIRNEFVAAGHRTVFYDEHYAELEAWVVKFTPEGEILWSNSDTIWSDRLNGVTTFTAGIEISPSGSIYVAGRLEHDQNPRREYGWLLKVSPDGCFEPLCITTLTENVDLNDEYRIYPNPAFDYFIVDAPLTSKEAMIHISDISGRNLRAIDLKQGQTKIYFDFVPGLYFYSVYQGSKFIISGKLIVGE